MSQNTKDRNSNRLGKILLNITIEPAVFLIAFAYGIDNIATSQLIVDKACDQNFDFNETVCENLNSDEFKEQNIQVSNQLNQFNVYKTLIGSVFPIFFSFYLGAWTDLFGRKFLFYVFLIGFSTEQAIILVCAHFFESTKEYLLLAYIPTSLSGGLPVWLLTVNAFISDISLPEDRAFKFGMVHLAHFLGKPPSTIFGAYLLRTGGYVCVYASSLLCIAIGAILLTWRINRFQWKPERKSIVSFRKTRIYLII